MRTRKQAKSTLLITARQLAAAAQVQMYMHDVEAEQQATHAGACGMMPPSPWKRHDKAITDPV
jgi:hypothetical protein